MNGRRGQSAILGLILLIGIVAIVSVGILVHAGQSTADAQQEMENERIEAAFVQLSQTMATTASTGDTTEVIDFAAGEHGAIVKTDTGEIRISGGDLPDPIEVSIGAIEYQGDDGTRIAYQAGGVFRETGNETRVVSAPPIYYDESNRVTEDTLNFPIVEVYEDSHINSGEILISYKDTTSHQEVPVIEDDIITVEITSEYCVGWENYFERQTREGGDAIVESCDEGEIGTVEAELGSVERQHGFDRGAVVFDEDYISDHCANDCVIGDDWAEDQPPVLDKYIEQIVGSASNENSDYEDVSSDTSPHNLSDGKYYVDGISESDSFTFNLHEGNATLVIDGDVNFGDIKVKGDNELKMYADGDEITLDGNVRHEEGKVENIQLFGTSDMHVDGGPGMGGYYEGLIYIMSHEEKPNEWDTHSEPCDESVKPQAQIQAGQVTFDGVLVAYSICGHAQGHHEFGYNERFDGETIQLLPEGYKLPPNVYHLNVVEHLVDVESS